MSERWKEGRNILWFVFGENGSIWLCTASFTRSGAIKEWVRQAGYDWEKWRRDGFRCRKAKIKYQPI